MTKLTFPTDAEKVIAEFKAKTRTTSVRKFAFARGATLAHEWPRVQVYYFPDDTTLRVSGRGRSHTMEAFLP